VIAFEVAKAAMADGVAVTISDDLLQQKIRSIILETRIP
jgi:malate dehydrogenase (oxaloacetate-decarboxylating)